MINNVVLTGRLTAEPELKYTGSGTAVISFNLAVDRTFKNAQGERETDFVNCVAWRKTAELIANNLRKGSLFGVVGRIQTRNYTNNDGKKVYVTEVVCESVQFLESKNSNQHSDNNQNNKKSPDFDEDPFEKNDDPVQIDDSDLPF
ncbi:single-stranded DNA-binding protein [Marinilactibacillus psychrotolerans]|uniref:single-stranded DNA-binding protein n=1 Tax=Marinilactibacillus psychrotolerans TaxID=191770 RepID=UPI00388A434B